jgi:hypothetical protein
MKEEKMTLRQVAQGAVHSGVAFLIAVVGAVSANAQPPAAEGALAAPSSIEANNPLAKFRAFNMHNYYVPALSEADGQNANTFWFRYAQPFGKWLFRASLPVSQVPTDVGTTTSGLSDLNAFAAYLFDTGDPKLSLGLGPQITVPTATQDETGSGKWQGGVAATVFNARSSDVQWGGLVTWQTDFAGDENRPGTNLLAVQPFYFVQFGKGLYARGAPVAVFNLETGSYNVPVGLGLGKVVPTGNKVFNLWLEPQFTVLSHGAGQPELQIFVGFNTQFVSK